tara:strand:- start:577 stop:1155 length:579 start_codon:yes stop_codon:yes gene_type:complete
MHKLILLLITIPSIIFSEPKEGQDYNIIPDGLIKLDGVTEIFWYGCPACFAYEEILEEIAIARPEVKINKIPLFTEPTAKTYYAIESLQLGNEAHQRVFEDWQLKRRQFKTENDIRLFAKRHGFDEEDLARAFNSFSVQIKARNAINLPRRMIDSGVDFSGTPTTVVNGKYLVTRQRDNQKEIEIILYLLDK